MFSQSSTCFPAFHFHMLAILAEAQDLVRTRRTRRRRRPGARKTAGRLGSDDVQVLWKDVLSEQGHRRHPMEAARGIRDNGGGVIAWINFRRRRGRRRAPLRGSQGRSSCSSSRKCGKIVQQISII